MRRTSSLLIVGGYVLFLVSWAVGTALAAQQGRQTLVEWQRDLRDPSPDVRARAAQALSTFEHRAVAALTSALNDTEYKVRSAAAGALVEIGPGPVVPRMIEALKSPDVPVRANAAVVLGAFGQAAKPAIPALARALKDANSRVRELAGEALRAITATGPVDPASFLLNCH